MYEEKSFVVLKDNKIYQHSSDFAGMNNLRDEAFLVKVGERIRQLRKEKGLSMDQLCLECEMEKTQLHRIETGKYNTTISTLRVLARELGVSLSDLFKGL